jgi:hypothetical protein
LTAALPERGIGPAPVAFLGHMALNLR